MVLKKGEYRWAVSTGWDVYADPFEIGLVNKRQIAWLTRF